MPRLALAVLSGCETAGAAPTRGGGLSSLAAPFLLAGAGSVIGTLWRVDDVSSASLTPRLYAELAAGEPPRRALRAAQLSFLRDPDPVLQKPRSWASFVVLERRPAGE